MDYFKSTRFCKRCKRTNTLGTAMVFTYNRKCDIEHIVTGRSNTEHSTRWHSACGLIAEIECPTLTTKFHLAKWFKPFRDMITAPVALITRVFLSRKEA